jgi:hypothetical protein
MTQEIWKKLGYQTAIALLGSSSPEHVQRGAVISSLQALTDEQPATVA